MGKITEGDIRFIPGYIDDSDGSTKKFCFIFHEQSLLLKNSDNGPEIPYDSELSTIKIDLTKGIGKFSFLFLLGIKGGFFALQLLLGLIFILPFELVFRIFCKKKQEGQNA